MASTVVALCASMFDWATYRKTKGVVKLHLRLDHDDYLAGIRQHYRGERRGRPLRPRD